VSPIVADSLLVMALCMFAVAGVLALAALVIENCHIQRGKE